MSAADPLERTDYRTFAGLWVGQLVSLLGSSLTAFSIGLWVLKNSHSVSQYTFSVVLATLPGIVLGPFAGARVDRFSRKAVMLLSDLGAELITVVYFFLLAAGRLELWHVYLGIFINSICATFQWPAYVSTLSLLARPRDLGRINGMVELGQAATTIAAPALAGWLMVTIGIHRILLIDFATFSLGSLALLLIRLPRPVQSAEGAEARGSIWHEARYGWTFIRRRPGLFRLLGYFAVLNFVASLCGVAAMPMILAFSNEATVGRIMSLVGVGMLLGGATMSLTGGPRPRIVGALGAGLVIGFSMVLIGLRPNVWLVGSGVLLCYVTMPIMQASAQAIWQSKTPPDVQGRVFAVRRMIAQLAMPLGAFSAGPLADRIFNPALTRGGALAGSAGRLVGVGPGRGIGLMFLTFAILPVLASIWGFLDPRVRRVESELPDARGLGRAAPVTPDLPAEPVEAPAI